MVASRVQHEYTNLLFAHYGRAKWTGIFIALIIVYLIFDRVDIKLLSVWLILKVLAHLSYFGLAIYYRNTQVKTSAELRRWQRTAFFMTLLQGIIWAYLLQLITSSMAMEFLLLGLILVATTMAYIASGYTYLAMAYATPIHLAIAVTCNAKFPEFPYPIWLPFIAIHFTYIVAKFFQRSLLDSISIRFENQDLLKELKMKKHEAEQANKAKSVFLASASHDLRQPLHAIGLYLDSLSCKLNSYEQKELAVKMENSLDRLTELFGSLLDISKLDSGSISIHLKPINLRELLSQLCVSYADSAKSKGLKLENTVDDVVILTDPLILERVVSNLLSNAVKYTDKGVISVYGQLEDGFYYLKVKDTGRGIPQAEQEKIFSEFYQIEDNNTERAEGLGLGLSIVRKMCDLLDIKVLLQSKPKEGSVFSLQLPLTNESGSSSSSFLNSNSIRLTGKRVLFIDDDPDIRGSIAAVMSRWGCDVETFSMVDLAKQRINDGFDPDVLICDYRLGGKSNGVDALRELQSLTDRPLPKLIITGDTSPELITEITAEIPTILFKPLKPGELRKTLSLLLNDEHITG